MSKTFSAARLALSLATWAQEATNPNTAAISGAAGSFFQRNGNGAGTPTELYLNLIGTATGWTKQNLVNVNIFNVKNSPYNATGNGITDDTDAIWAAIQACNTAGGGIVYFPPGSYQVKKRLTTLATFEMQNMHNITFLGDGFASKIQMNGDGALADWYLFYLHNGTSFIKFENLYLDGVVTNHDEQTHLIFFGGANADTHGSGAHDCDVVGCYFGPSPGDNVRFLGTALGGPTYNIHVHANSIDSPHCRTGVAYQRYVYRTLVSSNFMSGSDDQEIDFEPTGGSPPLNEPDGNVVRGNIFDHLSKSVICLTFNGIGATSPNQRCVVAYNQLHNGSSVEGGRDVSQCSIHGNIFLYTAPLGGDVGLDVADGVLDHEITSNVFDRPNVAGQLYRAITLIGGSASRARILVADNVGRTAGDAGGGIGFLANDCSDTIIEGNICEMVTATAGNADIFLVAPAAEAMDGAQVIGNMAIATNAAALAAYEVGGSNALPMGNWAVNYNYSRGSTAGLRLPSSSTGFHDWRIANNNNFTVTTGNNISILGFTNGVTLEGNAGPSAAAIMIDAAAGPEGQVPSPKGSFCMNTSGGDATVMFVKETDGGSSTSTTGWLNVGPCDIDFAAQNLVGGTTTALFLAPGMDLVNATAIEIKIPIPRPGVLLALRVACVAGVGAGSITYTVRKNGVDTALALAISNTTIGGSVTGSIAVVAGDLLSIKVTKSAGVATAQTFATASLEMA